jgi:hypothetical protein
MATTETQRRNAALKWEYLEWQRVRRNRTPETIARDHGVSRLAVDGPAPRSTPPAPTTRPFRRR